MNFPLVARAFIFDPTGRILLTRHHKDAFWVLPGGHVENNEDPHTAIVREIREEFGIHAHFFEIDSEEVLFHKGKKLHHMPLPIAIYDLEYKNAEWKDRSRREYVFLMETDEEIQKVDSKEIFEYRWFDADDILALKVNEEIFDFTVEMLEKIIGNDEDFE